MQSENLKNVETFVRWYSPKEGFGFLACPVLGQDVFLHFSTLDAFGFKYIAANDEVVCDIEKSRRGFQVSKISQIKRKGGQKVFDSPELENLPVITGIVRWFNDVKAFGFIKPNDSEGDIFVHIETLRKSNKESLKPGEQVFMRVCDSSRGREAKAIKTVS